MSAAPLTHHDIVALVQPFAQRGRHVDLAVSTRLERKLVFKPHPLDDGGAVLGAGAMHDVLLLEGLSAGLWRLTRTVHLHRGPPDIDRPPITATLVAVGRDAGELLARVDAVPARRHFSIGPAHTVARHYELDGALPVLMRAVVHLPPEAGVQLKLTVPAAKRLSADVELLPVVAAGSEVTPTLALTEDLLAVLGWGWSRLVPGRFSYTGKLRLRGSPEDRTARAEAALDTVAAHLAQTLTEPPARFHERLAGARFGVMFRRGIPAGMAVLLLLGVALLPRFDMGAQPGLWVVIYHVPTALIALSFSLQDLARFELPPWPRPLHEPHWHHRPAAPAALRTEGDAPSSTSITPRAQT